MTLKARPGGRIKGRGAGQNPRNRFETLSYEKESWTNADPGPATEFFRDNSRSIISYNDSPDVGFDASVNPYRGCEHGCAYCFARPNHEYLGFSAGLDFESRILVKSDAAKLLRRELGQSRWRPQPIAMRGVTDPYQPLERSLELARRCLEVLAEYRNPVVLITKSDLVVRDCDILESMASWQGSLVFLSVTTLDRTLGRQMEPRAATPARRLSAIRALSDRGIPVGVLAAPMVPGLTDHEIPAILAGARQAGAGFAGYIPLRLPYGVSDLFEEWLAQNVPGKKEKVLNRIQSIRSGRMNDPGFVTRMSGHGPYAKQMKDLFDLGCQQTGLNRSVPKLSVSQFQVPASAQASLFS